MLRFCLLFVICLLPNFSMANMLNLPIAKDLFADGQKVWENKTPILIMFSVANCIYCKEVKEEVIAPMADLAAYKNKVIIRHVNADTLEEMKDFYNNNTNHGKFSFQNGIDFYPTIVLMNNYGANLGKIIGIPSMEYYWTDLDKLIDKSIVILKKQLKAKL